ncbi:MAG: DNA polymerase III subunit beta [Chloroflexi bacterium]|nr:DNA polymerase III subunit beta [Chloroflexota bacterium]
MRLTCLQQHLNKALSVVVRAVPAKSTLPVALNVLLATEEGRLRLAGTNLDLAITTWVTGNVEAEGAISVPARILSGFVSSLDPDRLELTLNQRTRTLTIHSGGSEANIKGVDAEEFPPIPRAGGNVTVSVDPATLREGIEQVAFAAATDDSRPVLAGVLASFDGDSLTLAAADGFRLAVRRLDLRSAVAERLDIIVPRQAMVEMARLLADESEPAELSVSPNRSQLLVHTRGADLVTRLIEGTFPNYEQIIPTRYQTRVLISTSDFLKATRRAEVFATDAANMVRLQITPGEELAPGKMLVTARAAELGDNTSQLDVVVEGGPTQIAFNAKYLKDVLSALPNVPQVGLEVSSPASPGVIRPAGGDGYTHVIMPMHVNQPRS